MKIYILSSGNQYDGYEVEGVYSSEAQAKKEANRRLRVEGEYYRLETWEIDGKCKGVEWLDDEDQEEENEDD